MAVGRRGSAARAATATLRGMDSTHRSPVAPLGTILSVWAHPDDETYLAGGVMAAARDRGQRVVCASATAGEHGTADPVAWPPERLGEVRRLAGIARAAGLPVHMDGTRLANALARQGVSPAEMTWKAGIDALCLGATKNGAMAAEAVILFDSERAWEFELRRKRGGHLFSKMRFLSAQIEAYLTDGLWLRLAGRANAMADRLAEGLVAGGARVLNTIGANMLFAEITLAQHRRLEAAGARYYTMTPFDPAGDAGQRIRVRLVASFRTTEGDVDRLVDALAG